MLQLFSALKEIVYSNILDEILPLAVLPCVALAERDTRAITTDRKKSAVLLFREKCLRPGHFLQNQRFSNLKGFGFSI